MKKLDSSDKKVLKIWTIGSIVIIALVLFINIELGVIDVTKIFNTKYYKVNDTSRHATVSNVLVKYYSYINIKDYDSILLTYSDEYKKQNNIDKNNVKTLITNSDVALTYNSRIMCSKKISNNETSYLVSGFESETNTGKRLNNKYYEVILNSSDFHFSISEIEENKFLGDCHD